MNKTAGQSAFQRERARKQHRKAAGPLLDKALRLYQAGIMLEAQTLCLQVLENLPDHFDALHLLGLLKSKTGQLEEAEAILRRAIEVDPRSAEILSNLGVVLFDRGNFDQARISYERAITLRPNSPVALNNLGNALFKMNFFDRAILSFDRAIALKPDYVDAIYNRGNALLGAQRSFEALEAFQRVIAMKPVFALAHNGRGLAYLELKRFDEALACFDEALRLAPDQPQAMSNRARRFAEIGDIEAAFDQYAKTLAIAPDFESAVLGHARLLMGFGRLTEAFDNCRRAVEIAPQSCEALTILAQCLAHQGRIEDAIGCFDKALAIRPDHEGALTKKIFALDFDPRVGFPELQRARSEWWRRIGSQFAKVPDSKRNNTLDPDRRLVVGYVSADFRDHSAALIFGPVLRNHDKTAFEIVCYSCTPLRDAVTDDIRRVSDKWVEAWRMTDDQLTEQILSDRIDVLVDLSGFTGGHRLCVFSRKPAPVQITAWGHGSGNGIPEIDYVFSDPVSIPSEFRHLFAERVYDLPCLLTIDPPTASVEPALLPPCVAKGYVTFGVFNRIDKISTDAVRVWSQILLAVPRSKLLIKHSGLDDPALRQITINRFGAHGVEPERIQCLGSTPRPEHLAAYQRVDICLDPFPQNGGVSTFEALHMGVPVVAKVGGGNAGRAGGAILSAVGLPEWVGRSEKDYVEIALKYAAQPDHLAKLRPALPAQVLASAVGNTATYTRAAEAAYRQFWKEYCASKLAPAATPPK